ncbi:MAG: NAD(P)-dependent oxidoreductase [Patescibacteria group bacterium]
MKTVLITGGTGFLGRNIIPLLLEKNYKVSNLAPGTYEDERVENIFFDAHEDDPRETLKGRDFDFVLHLAAYSTPKLATEYEKTMKLNVEFTEKLLQSASTFPSLKGFFFFSTALVYSDKAARPLREEALTETRAGDFYSESKIKAEAVCKHFYDQGLPLHIWRLTNCFGPYQAHFPHPNLIPQIMKEAIDKKKVTILNGSYTRDFLFSKDLASLIVEALELKDAYFLLNVATGTPHSVSEIAEVVAKELDAPIEDLKKELPQSSDLTLNISKLKTLFPHFKFTAFDEALRSSLAYYIHIV